MTFKKFLIFICLITVLFTVASVNASDVNETVMASEDQDNEVILAENQDSDKLSATEENKLSANTGTFTNLANEIKKADNELNLTRDYVYTAPIGYRETDVRYVEGIPVNKQITINGNGFTINGKNIACAFFIFNTNNQIVLNNITFKNCYTPSIGGAIYSNGENIVISNCKFIDNSAKEFGGAMHIVGDNSIISNCTFINNKAPTGGALVTNKKCTIINCTFINNKADNGGAFMTGEENTISNCIFTNNSAKLGGALWVQDHNSAIMNCIFTNNVAKEEGGAICSVDNADNLIISNSTFTNNKATTGGAISSYSPNTVSNCSFTNNTADRAGAIWIQGANCTVINCKITNNTANRAGAIWIQGANCTVINCKITNNTASDLGGAIFLRGSKNSYVKNCNFSNNNAAEDGGAVYVAEFCTNAIISNSTFTNNKAKDGGSMLIFSPTTVLDCSFTNNTAANSAGAIWMQAVNSTIINCSFTNNTASKRAGAVIMTATENCNVKNCNFTNNVAKEEGGAISWDYNNNGNVEHSYFYNNTANEGGAMYGGTAVNCSFINNNVYNTTIQFNVKDNAAFIGSVVLFYGLPECNLTVTATDKNKVTKTFECTDKGWNIENLKAGTYTVKFTIKQYDENKGEFTTKIDVKTKQIQELDELIRNTQNDTIVLDYDYSCYDKGNLANGIIINKSVTIDGQGHKIDGNNLMRIFQVNNNAEVTFKNIIFANGQAKYGGFGAAIWNNGAKSVTAINCTFESNTASYGGAISNVNALICSFNNNKASGFGGAMWGGSAVNCSFIGNTARYGGAMQRVSYAHNCSFISNSASDLGGAMNGGSAVNCSFINNTASTGSAIYTGSADNCTFVNNNAYHTQIKFYIDDKKIFFPGNTVSFQGLPECNLKVTVTKDGISKEFSCDNKGWKIGELELGMYDVQFTIESDNNNGKLNTVMQLGYALDLSVDVEDIFVGQSETVRIYATNKTFNKVVTLNINGTNYSVNFVDGYGSCVVSNLVIGEYNVTVNFKDDKFWPVKKSVQFEVTPKFDLNLTVSVEDIIEGQDETVKIHTIDIFNGNVTLSINGNNQTINIVNGTGNYTYNDMPTGNYTVTVSFNGNTEFNADSKTAKFEVLSKQNLNLNVIVENITEGNMAIVSVSANELFDGAIKISINDTDIQNETLELIEGKATYYAMDLNAGNYTVTVSFDGNVAFNPDSKSVKFEVKPETEKADLNMVVTVENIFVGENATVKVTTNDTFNGKVILIINGIVNDNITIKDGKGSYDIENLSAGNYAAYVGFNGDNVFKADAKASMFEVEKRELNLTASVEDIFVGQSTTVKVNTNNLFEGNLSIVIAGIARDIITVTNGEGSYTIENIPAGNYTIYIEFKGDNAFKADNNEVQLTVKKYDLDLYATVDDIFEGQGATVNITTNASFTGNVTVSINDINYTASVVDGVGSYVEYDLAEGNYIVTVSFNGNDRFNDDKTSNAFKVKPKYNLELNVKVLDIFEGQTETVEIYAINIFNGNVTILVNDHDYTVNVVDGFGSYNASDLPIGKHTVTVVYDGNYKFNPDEKSAQFEVTPKFDLDLTVSVEDIIEGQDETVKIHTIDLFNGTVNLSINGNNQTLTIVNGTGNCTYNDMPTGNYTVTISFNGNTEFNADSKTVKFKVIPKYDLNLNVIVTDIEEGNMAIVSVSTNELFNGEINISINGTDIQNETLELIDGKGSYSIIDLSAGNYTATVSFDGDYAFNPASKTAKFEVKPQKEKIDLNLTITVENIFEGQNAIVKVRTNNTFTGNVMVIIRGIFEGSIHVVNGAGSYSVKDLSEDSYNVYVGYNGDYTFKADATVFRFDVKPAYYNIIKNKNVTMLYTAKSPYKVLVTKSGNPVGAGEVVTIKFNGKTYKVKTDKNGYATLKLPNVKPKKAKYTITATYKGVTVKNTVKVNSIIKAKNKKVKKSKKVTKIKVSLKKVNNKYLKNKKIKIKFKGKTYKVKTNKKGVATWKVKKSMLKKLKVGKKYKYKVTYGKDVVTKKLTIKK